MKKTISKRPTQIDSENRINGFKSMLLILKITNFLHLTNVAIDDLQKQLKELENSSKKLNIISEEFNSFFVKKGWVCYGSLNFELMEKCVNLAKERKANDAENMLYDYYSNENIKYELWRLANQLETVKLREDLLNLCFEDYKQERYHACIPLLLMMIDGIVCDTNPEQKSGANARIDAWDSITCSDNGVNKLYKDIIHKTRRKTTNAILTLPYRNGILHGRDLGYANKEVAIKTWNLFFAICSWANEIKSENWRKEKYNKEHENDNKTLFEILREYEEHKKEMGIIDNKLNEWKPRKFKKKDYPIDIFKTEFPKNSPEQSLKELLEAWQKGQYGKISKVLMNVKPEDINKYANDVKNELSNKECHQALITKIDDQAPAVTEYELTLKCQIFGIDKTYKKYKIRLICQDDKNNPTTRNNTHRNLEWRFISAFLYNLN